MGLGPDDFHDAENTDGITELDDKNGISCKTRNIVEFAKMWAGFFLQLLEFYHSF